MANDTVVLLHGIWMPAGEMLVLKHRLESEHDLSCHNFSYPSVRGALDDNAGTLAEFLTSLDADRIHLIGHSLGGLMALRMLATTQVPFAGRVVCLGSPLCGSRAAARLAEMKWGKLILGESLPRAALGEPASEWATAVVADHEVGVIAGDVPAGIGRFFAEFDEPNDGTVSVAETQLPGIRDHLVLPVSHSGMVLSTAVADQAAAFVARGEFLREP